MDRIFGFEQLRKNPLFDNTLRTSPELNSDQAQVVLSMVYDTAFGVHDHYSPDSTNPLSTVAMHEREEYDENSGLYRAIERFDSQEIHSRFGLSLEQYLALPRDVIDMLTNATIAARNRMQAIENEEKQAHHDRNQRTNWGSIRK